MAIQMRAFSIISFDTIVCNIKPKLVVSKKRCQILTRDRRRTNWTSRYWITFKVVVTLKNVRKTCEFEFAQRMKARNVETPPLRTAGPILVSESETLWSRVPGVDRNSWVTWAALSTDRYVHQLNSILLTFHNRRSVQKSKSAQSKFALRVTFTPSAAHLTVFLYLCSSRSKAQS